MTKKSKEKSKANNKFIKTLLGNPAPFNYVIDYECVVCPDGYEFFEKITADKTPMGRDEDIYMEPKTKKISKHPLPEGAYMDLAWIGKVWHGMSTTDKIEAMWDFSDSYGDITNVEEGEFNPQTLQTFFENADGMYHNIRQIPEMKKDGIKKVLGDIIGQELFEFDVQIKNGEDGSVDLVMKPDLLGQALTLQFILCLHDKKYPVECNNCGKFYLAERVTSKFCGTTCRQKNHRSKK